MIRKLIVNGVSYEGVESMPPEVRRQYELAMKALEKAKQEDTSRVGASERPADVNIVKVAVDIRQPSSRNLWLWLAILAGLVALSIILGLP